jgi:hypothetical protein
MSKRALILVEGQTEERFVKDVLGPAFFEKGLFFSPTLLVTKRVKDGPNFKGGVTNFAKFENDARRLLSSPGGALVTTLLDYYGLPMDFPGMGTRPANAPALRRVTHVEAALHVHFGQAVGFLPFLMLHEFEAWLFADPAVLPRVLTDSKPASEFAAIRAAVKTPEEINERPDWAPSKRIERLFPAYKKTAHGPIAAKRIGIDKIRSDCPHFDHWLRKLEAFAEA